MHTQNINFKQGILYNSKIIKNMPKATMEEFRTIVNENRAAFSPQIDLLLTKTKHPSILRLTPIIKAENDKYISAGVPKQIDFSLEKIKTMASDFSEFVRINFNS